jgi:hypothetical protein
MSSCASDEDSSRWRFHLGAEVVGSGLLEEPGVHLAGEQAAPIVVRAVDPPLAGLGVRVARHRRG